MASLVQKFGGTSVADVQKMRACARRAIDARGRGYDVAVVVSAMGKTTDQLVALAAEASANPARREMDALLSTGERISIALMAMVLEDMGQPAISFAARQVGIRTDEDFTRARITAIASETIRAEFDAGRVVVVAGFQGIGPGGDVTTLGRGGSDTTAVAVAAAIGAEACEIYTDVDGVYTADPRKVPGARKLARITYDEMLEMSALGAGVLHPRAVQFGARFGVPIHVRHSHKPDEGTLITSRETGMDEAPSLERVEVAGVALKENLGRVTLDSIPDTPGVAARVFAALAEAGVVVDDIIQTEGEHKKVATISFTADHADLSDIDGVLSRLIGELGGGSFKVDRDLCKVSAVGVGIHSHAAIAATMFRTLADAEINIANITTSEIKVCVIIGRDDGERAMRLVHDAFGLGDQEPGGR